MRWKERWGKGKGLGNGSRRLTKRVKGKRV